jgi:hypothetical protein
VNAPAPISLSAYARHRACSLTAVRNAVKKGKLKEVLVHTASGVKITDVKYADQLWEQRTEHNTTPPAIRAMLEAREAQKREAPEDASDLVGPMPVPSAPRERRAVTGDAEPPAVNDAMTLSEASAIEKRWRAKLVQLEFRKKAGELIEAAEVKRKLADVITACRAKILGVPTRARQRLPHLTPEDVVTLDALVREALEELAVGDFTEAAAAGEDDE